MSDQQRESFIRWQDYRIKHLSFSINLFLGFAVASLGYLVSSQDSTVLYGPARLILAWWAVSASAGVLATISRLVDFRYTTKRVRAGRKGYLCLTALFGHATWILFGCAVCSYCIGAWLFIQTRLGF